MKPSGVLFVFVLLASQVSSADQETSTCALKVELRGDKGYHKRGSHCEGLYYKPRSAYGKIKIISFMSMAPEAQSGDLTLTWQVPVVG
jgi:hypothetical protein